MEISCIQIRHARCYLIEANGFYIAIDAGWPGHLKEYLSGLKRNAIRPDQVKYLFVTHFHPDHAGLTENLKGLGATFVVFEHQLPYVPVMERMIGGDRAYLPIDKNTNVVINIDDSAAFFSETGIPTQAVKTAGHSGDSISMVFEDGSAFTGDLYAPDLVMEDDEESKTSWHALRMAGARKIYPAHAEPYCLT